ncbi:uncharacterized protein LOC110931767 [Helianthus annuus]|uniref:uncharacterized protein LOC110931767 n=1 Tax=Helianthus annuus TaxID=4232 RepID=UPI000B8FA4AB|nr:uncharacterized protein LOC110931767 [Helianthus annuus]
MPFKEGKLPVKYLGVPLVSAKLGYNDCRVLVERLEKRIMHWRNKLLSFAGRLQLTNSVLSSMHIYWSSVFILPVRIIKDLEAKMRNFLWSQESAFSKGNGATTSAWYDNWTVLGPLADFLSARVITDADFRLEDSVTDVYSNGGWRWPLAWRDLFPVLIQIDQVLLDPLKNDRLLWKDGNELNGFSSSGVWHSLRHREPEVDWCNIVWCGRKFGIGGGGGMNSVSPKWSEIVEWLCARSHHKRADIYVAKLLVAATAYNIWQERNATLFKNQLRPPETVSDVIIKTVRYKLMGAKLKDTVRVRKILEEWEIHADEKGDDGG